MFDPEMGNVATTAYLGQLWITPIERSLAHLQYSPGFYVSQQMQMVTIIAKSHSVPRMGDCEHDVAISAMINTQAINCYVQLDSWQVNVREI